MGGTAPDEGAWLFVEYAGLWGRKAVAESRLPDDVREFLDGLDGIRVQLVRRHGGVSGPGVRVFTARLGAEPGVEHGARRPGRGADARPSRDRTPTCG